MTILTIVLSIGCFIGFAWAIRGHFKQVDGMPPGMRLVSFLSLAGFAWFLVARVMAAPIPSSGRPYLDATACLLFAASLALFWASIGTTRSSPLTLAFAADIPTSLQRRGPYRYVRHPFYLSYLTFWIGTALASASLLHWLMPIVMVPLYIEAARREERKFGGSTLASDYHEYRQRTGMLFPRLWRQTPRLH